MTDHKRVPREKTYLTYLDGLEDCWRELQRVAQFEAAKYVELLIAAAPEAPAEEKTRHPCGHLIVSDACVVCAPLTPTGNAALIAELHAIVNAGKGWSCPRVNDIPIDVTAAKAAAALAAADARVAEAERVRDDERVVLLRRARKAEAERDAAIKDTERYRWLRDIGDGTWTPMRRREFPGWGFGEGSAEKIDAAIDAAMKAAG